MCQLIRFIIGHNRTLNFLWAKLKGWSWTACPICNRKFGGHEAAKVMLYPPGEKFSMRTEMDGGDRFIREVLRMKPLFVCRQCEGAVEKMNKQICEIPLRINPPMTKVEILN